MSVDLITQAVETRRARGANLPEDAVSQLVEFGRGYHRMVMYNRPETREPQTRRPISVFEALERKMDEMEQGE